MRQITAADFLHSRASVRRARAFTAATLTHWATGVAVDDVCACVSELATNALVHGGRPGRRFLVRLSLSEKALLLEVHDGNPAPPQARRPTADDERGRGLLIVEALADEWGTAPRNGPGKLVWASFDLTSPRLPRRP